jgi:hypothetical protein
LYLSLFLYSVKERLSQMKASVEILVIFVLLDYFPELQCEEFQRVF